MKGNSCMRLLWVCRVLVVAPAMVVEVNSHCTTGRWTGWWFFQHEVLLLLACRVSGRLCSKIAWMRCGSRMQHRCCSCTSTGQETQHPSLDQMCPAWTGGGSLRGRGWPWPSTIRMIIGYARSGMQNQLPSHMLVTCTQHAQYRLGSEREAGAPTCRL